VFNIIDARCNHEVNRICYLFIYGLFNDDASIQDVHKLTF